MRPADRGVHACGAAMPPLGRYDQVLPVMTSHINSLRRLEQRSAMQRLMLSMIVVMLANDDAVGASQRYQEFLQYGRVMADWLASAVSPF